MFNVKENSCVHPMEKGKIELLPIFDFLRFFYNPIYLTFGSQLFLNTYIWNAIKTSYHQLTNKGKRLLLCFSC